MAYDITDSKRLRRVCRLMEDQGERLQYSVFLCDLSIAELQELEAAVTDAIHLADDSFIRIDLGPKFSSATIRTIGRGRCMPLPGPQIV